MILILALLAPLAQGRPIEASVDAFLKGDDAARAELVKQGAFAIRPLQKLRDRDPEKIDPLILQLKKVAAHPRGSEVATDLDREYTGYPPKNSVAGVQADLEKMHVPLFCVYSDLSNRDCEKTVVLTDKETIRTVLDQVCRLTGTDYGIFHNSIVLAKPERLWPSRPPAPPPTLPADVRLRADALMAQLGSDPLETRESSTAELLRIGPGVRPLLEAFRSRTAGEAAARCSALIDRFQPAPWVDFGPPSVQRMSGSKEAADLVAKLQEKLLGVGIYSTMPFSILDDYLFGVSGVRFKIQAADIKKMLVFWSGHSVFDQLCLNLQSHHLDFAIRGRDIVIDSRDAIEKLMSELK